jgi:hypothetical protein
MSGMWKGEWVRNKKEIDKNTEQEQKVSKEREWETCRSTEQGNTLRTEKQAWPD